MREILFRGKRIDNGTWVEGSLLKVSLNGKTAHLIFGDDFIFINKDVKALNHAFVDPATVGQYTGLTDKNGKKIFEGDIIRHYDDNPYDGVEEKGVVFWDEEFLCFRRTSNGGFHHGKVDTYRLSKQCDYEVIGNIHDNPELLKGV